MKVQSIKKGFTLIELLVVITIIGILATGATTVFTSQIQKARDSTRITNTNALRGGIEQYYQDTSVYPLWGSSWLTDSSKVDMQDFLPNLAEDPKHDQTCNGSRCGYVYSVWADSVGIVRGAYELSTAFENQGNVNSKADSTVDNGEDDARLELGTVKTGTTGTDLDTQQAQATAFDWADLAAADTSATIVIVNSGVDTK